MYLKLKNFRCYTEEEFDLGDTGTVLISGVSGKGKSTLFLAVNFALFGTGTKLITVGKTSLLVELQIGEMTIVRTKRPNRVLLTNKEGTFENEVAQNIIIDKFGKTFEITSYIAQNATNAFVVMSPLEKLSFLEKFAFEGIDIEQIKGRCKGLIKERNEHIISISSQYRLLFEELNNTKKPDEVPYPLQKKEKKVPEKKIDISLMNEEKKYKNNKIRLCNAQKKLEKVKSEYNDLKIFRASLDDKEKRLADVDRRIAQIDGELDNYKDEIDEEELKEKLNRIMNRQELRQSLDRYEEDQKRIKEMAKREKEELKAKIDTIKEELWKEYTREKCEDDINNLRENLKDAKELESLYKELSNLDEGKLDIHKDKLEKLKPKLEKKKELLRIAKQRHDILECPNCQQALRLDDGVLCYVDEDESKFGEDEINEINEIDELEEEIKTLQKSVSRLEYVIPREEMVVEKKKELLLRIDGIKSQYDGELSTVKELREDIDELNEYLLSQQKLETDMETLEDRLEKEKFSQTYEQFKSELKKQKRRIKELQSEREKEEDEEDDEYVIREKIVLQKTISQKRKELQREYDMLNSERSILVHNITELENNHKQKYNEIRKISVLEKTLNTYGNRVKELRETDIQLEKKMKEIEEYRRYREEIKKYESLEKRVNNLKNKEDDARKRYGAVQHLKELINQSENTAIINIINSINAHVQEYLDRFFVVEPMTARLMPFRETKKSVLPQINIQIEYKGMEVDFGMLSGGEQSRVVLAFTLGLAEIFNSPLLMLDECTASLDSDLTDTVIRAIKDNFPHKLVLIIAHQTTEGIYDKIVKL